jgi:hypothetical protein
MDSLKWLPSLSSLDEIAVNASCLDSEEKVSRLSQLRSLRKLSLRSPGRLVLQALPGWLENLGASLKELHLLVSQSTPSQNVYAKISQDNCGSITPGVLRGFLPHLGGSLTAFSMGISYSLTDTDIFEAIDQLRCLERLQLRYYYVGRNGSSSFCLSQPPSANQGTNTQTSAKVLEILHCHLCVDSQKSGGRQVMRLDSQDHCRFTHRILDHHQ